MGAGEIEYTGVGVDRREIEAREVLEQFFRAHQREVFFSRQIEIQNEGRYFHWVTNRALRDLQARGILISETRELQSGGSLKLLWHRSNRYWRRNATKITALVAEYSAPSVSAAVGAQGELLVLEGFARRQFLVHGRHSRSFRGVEWRESAHDLDFVFERDGRAYVSK